MGVQTKATFCRGLSDTRLTMPGGLTKFCSKNRYGGREELTKECTNASRPLERAVDALLPNVDSKSSPENNASQDLLDCADNASLHSEPGCLRIDTTLVTASEVEVSAHEKAALRKLNSTPATKF